MRLAQVSNRIADLSEQYEVPEKLGRVSEKVYDGMSVASEAAKKGAAMAYRAALDHPKTSIGGIILAAALVGGAIWYVFGDWGRPAPRKRTAARVRAGADRRKRAKHARAAAA